MNLLYKIRNFMNGRYGSDNLSKFIFGIYIILVVINLFLRNNIIFYVELFLLFIIVLRFFSKKIYKRGKENKLYLNVKRFILNSFSLIIKNIKDKNNVYKKCHKCKTVLKLPLPSKIGIKKVKCPECSHKNKFLILKKERIRIIRRKK